MLNRLWNVLCDKTNHVFGKITFVKRWRLTKDVYLALHEIVKMANPNASYVERCRWFIELVVWLKADFDEALPDSAQRRLLHLLQILEQHPDVHLRFSQTLTSIFLESDPVALFCDVGLPVKAGFWSELRFRLHQKYLPPPPNRGDLADLFRLMFSNETDAKWLASIDKEILEQTFYLFFVPPSTNQRKKISEDALTYSLRILLSKVTALAMNPVLRPLQSRVLDKNPFLKLLSTFDEVSERHSLFQHNKFNDRELAWQLHYLRGLLNQCLVQVEQMYQQFDDSGISVEGVFYLHSITQSLIRFEHLLELWLAPNPSVYRNLLLILIDASVEQSSIRRLFSYNYNLLARRINERSAETGEHYMVKTKEEARDMLRGACGGGLLTTITVYLKFLIVGLHLKPFTEGVLTSLNYAGSFLVIHFMGYTLATKQPAMTGPALAKNLMKSRSENTSHGFVKETIAVIRANMLSIFGNLVIVFPVAFLAQWIFQGLGFPLISQAKAQTTIDSLSIFGMTPIYAVFTGVLLWLSSLIAGWVDNWFAYHRIYEVLQHHRRLGFFLGVERLHRWVSFLKKQMAPLSANISLGFLLGLFPIILSFFGPELEVRHVTLSTGALAAAMASLGTSVLFTWGLWLAILGIVSIGFFNLLISFSFAFNGALRASGLTGVDRRKLAFQVLAYMARNPSVLWRVQRS